MRNLAKKTGMIILFAMLWPAMAGANDTELVMFSAKSCIYCQMFNREVKPRYKWSKAARRAPLREVDIETDGTAGYPLRRQITVTPTFVMFRHGREVARIRGYPGKKNFYLMVNRILKRIDQ